jgi:hypothetical protein
MWNWEQIKRDGRMDHLTEGKDERDGDEDGPEGGHERVQENRQRLQFQYRGAAAIQARRLISSETEI